MAATITTNPAPLEHGRIVHDLIAFYRRDIESEEARKMLDAIQVTDPTVIFPRLCHWARLRRHERGPMSLPSFH